MCPERLICVLVCRLCGLLVLGSVRGFELHGQILVNRSNCIVSYCSCLGRFLHSWSFFPPNIAHSLIIGPAVINTPTLEGHAQGAHHAPGRPVFDV